MKDIVIIPTYNEKENIAHSIAGVTGMYPDMEVWVVDDNSPDGTAAIVTTLAKTNPRIKLFTRTQKDGLGAAYKYILSHVKKRNDIRYVVTMDADGSHDSRSIKDLIAALSDADIAIGSRYVKGGRVTGWDKRRLALSYLGNMYSRFVTSSPIKDGTAGFVTFKAKDLHEINLEEISSAGYSYQIEFKGAFIKKGKKFTEVPITFTERQLGKSKMSGVIIIEGLKMPWRILMKDPAALKNRLLRLSVGVILVAALFFSMYELTESPSVWYDEGIYIQSAVNFLEKGEMGFQLSPGEITHISRISVSYPLIYPLAAWFKIFGQSVLAARFLMVLFIMTFLFLSYILSRRLFGVVIAFGSFVLLATFPPLYGNGKSVLGELPALTYLVGALISLHASYSGAHRRTLWLVVAGILAGLCVVTKPIFLMFIPALMVGLWVLLRRDILQAKQAGLFILAAIIPFVVWIFVQFQSGDTVASIFNAFGNPYRTGNIMLVMLGNIDNLFTDISPLYLMGMMMLWLASFVIRGRKSIGVEEITSFVFCCAIIVSYLRLSGMFRYLFPAQAIALIFLPVSLTSVIGWLTAKVKFLRDKKTISIVVPVALLVAYGCYGLVGNSWVAESYGIRKTAYWQDYFQNATSTQSYFFYDTPEVAIFMPHRNYYQFIAPNGWSFSDTELEILKGGIADYVIVRSDFLEGEVASMARNYYPVEQAFKYTILEKKR